MGRAGKMSLDDALEQHLALAEKLRGQLLALQDTLQSDAGAAPLSGGGDAMSETERSRERLLTLARSLNDADHLRQLCELAAKLKTREAGMGGAGLAQLQVKAAPPPAPAPPIEVTFGEGVAKLGISFESTANSDPPRIKSIAPGGAAAGFPQLHAGLLLRSVQDENVTSRGFKGSMEAVKGAGRPLTLQFVESAYSIALQKRAQQDDDSDDDGGGLGADHGDSFTLEWHESGKLGLTFGSEDEVNGTPPVKVTKVGQEAAALHSRLRVGLVIVGVQGVDVRTQAMKHVIDSIKSAGRPLRLSFCTSSEWQESAGDLIEEGEPDEGAGVGLEVGSSPAPKAVALGKVGGTVPPLGEYKLLVGCRCYVGPEMEAEPCEYSLDAEEVFEVIETKVVGDGVIRLRSNDGWINYLHAITGGAVCVSTAEVEGATDVDTIGDEDGVDHTTSATMVIFEKEGKLGMTFGSDDIRGGPPIKITKINPTGLGAQQPALRRGLVILTIQGDDMRTATLSEVTAAIKGSRRPLTLEFEKDSSNLDALSAIAVLRQTKGAGQEQHRMAIGMEG